MLKWCVALVACFASYCQAGIIGPGDGPLDYGERGMVDKRTGLEWQLVEHNKSWLDMRRLIEGGDPKYAGWRQATDVEWMGLAYGGGNFAVQQLVQWNRETIAMSYFEPFEKSSNEKGRSVSVLGIVLKTSTRPLQPIITGIRSGVDIWEGYREYYGRDWFANYAPVDGQGIEGDPIFWRAYDVGHWLVRPTSSVAAAVPEPCGVVMLLVGVALIARKRI